MNRPEKLLEASTGLVAQFPLHTSALSQRKPNPYGEKIPSPKLNCGVRGITAYRVGSTNVVLCWSSVMPTPGKGLAPSNSPVTFVRNEAPMSTSKCFCHPRPAGLKKMADGSSATAVKAGTLPIAFAPWDKGWKPEGYAGNAVRKARAKR